MTGALWVFVFMHAGLAGPSDLYTLRDLTEAQCTAMLKDFSTKRSFAACYGPNGETVKVRSE